MKTWTLSLAAAAGTLLLASTSHADQCAWITDAQAAKAAAILAKHPKVIAFCEPCGDKAPGEPAVASSADVTTPEAGYREVTINGSPVDLAYTYVQTSPTRYANLAKLAKCPATGVSPFLTVKDETPSGQLITGNQSAWPPDPPPLQVPVKEPAPSEAAPPPPPSVSYYHTTVEASIPWSIVALAAAAGFMSGATFTLGAVALRRRRSMKPRATDL